MAISSGSSFCFAPLPIFAGKDYNQWQKKMETFFISQGLWNLVQKGKITPTSQQRIDEEEDRKFDAQALYYIQQAVAPVIFAKFISASSAKEAWDFLEKDYNHQIKFLDTIDFHAIEIPEKPDTSWLTCCIRDISKNLRDVNPAAYTPQSVSIGPLHHGRPELANMEKRKFYYAKNFLDRTQKQKDLFVRFIKQHEESIRRCYSKPSELSSREYVEMIMLDSFFIFELFIWYQDKTAPEYADESLLHELWFRNNILLDLMLFENQLPYGLLSELYKIGFDNDREHPVFANLCLEYFNVFNQKQIVIFEEEIKKQLHFTGLVRHFNCSETATETKRSKNNRNLKYAANKLSESKVKFYGIRDGSLTDISFKKRVFKLPRFSVDNTTERICCNLMGLEQCDQLKDKAYICSYILLLQLLIQTSADVEVLIEAGVIINGLDSNQAVVDMFNKLCKNVTIGHFHFYDICKELDDYCFSWSGWWNYCRKTLNDVYFTNIWRGTGTIAAVVLLLLTLTQTITSILQVRGS